MREAAEQQLKEKLGANAQRDAVRARSVWFDNADLDALDDSVLQKSLMFRAEGAPDISFCAHLLLCSKNPERTAAHAINIAETVVWMVTGEAMPIERSTTKIASLSIDSQREEVTDVRIR